MADVGDGWNPTYAVATLLARPAIDPARRDGTGKESLPRGDVLVFGGDEVYPTASRDTYEKRLVAPYRVAFAGGERPPDVFAVPGNHDWYDGLGSFMRLFCQKRTPGGLPTKQSRSYFALKLPKNWWLIGVDVQLESDIDGPQIAFFQALAEKELRAGQRIILCTPEPDWIYGNIYDRALENNLAFLQANVLESGGAKVRVRIAGDLHHYRRHELAASADGKVGAVHNIVAGGGGAFLHPTHPHADELKAIKSGPDDALVTYVEQQIYPDRSTSRRLTFRNLLFIALNPAFGLVTGVLYAMLALGLGSPADAPTSSWMTTLLALLSHPAAMILTLVIIAAFMAFTDTHKLAYRLAGGGMHGLAHVLAALSLAGAANVAAARLGCAAHSPARQLFVFITTGLGGYVVGATLMGVYLLISLNVFGRHSNEAFSSLCIQGYKNFLRMRVDERGKLRVVAIGIPKVPTRWKEAAGATPGSIRFVPEEGQETPFLEIDDFTVD